MVVRESRAPISFPLPLTHDMFDGIVASGAIAGDRLMVFMAADVYDHIREHSKKHDPREVGGALLGQYCLDGETRFVIVSTAIPCDLGSATPVSINFPPEFWQAVEEVHTSRYPGLLRLGPYHSHPGYGVHPSGTDQTTILRTFSHPHHISIIYDPHADELGYTCWQDGELMEPSGCFIYQHQQPELLLKELMEARPE